MEKRPDPYTTIHKALRKQLFEASIELARVDVNDASGRAGVAARLREIVSTLRAHARHENIFLHPLLGDSTVLDALEHAHKDQDAELDNVEEAIRTFERDSVNGPDRAHAALYHEWNLLIADQLVHLDYEERAVLKFFYENVPSEKLAAAHGRMIASFSPEQIERSLTWICEAESMNVVKMLLSGLPAGVPPSVISASARAREAAAQLGMLERAGI